MTTREKDQFDLFKKFPISTELKQQIEDMFQKVRTVQTIDAQEAKQEIKYDA